MNFKFIFIFIVLVTLSCSSQEYVDLIIGNNLLKIEIAQNDEERAKGLMFRETLGEHNGMLFVFNVERPVSFWMKNTLIPLSIAYIDKRGKILEIYDMEPHSTEPKASKRSSILYALEVNQGYFQNNNISEGDYINLDKVLSYSKSSK